jgi:5-methylcytosine-specific restriction endonuclease McrA
MMNHENVRKDLFQCKTCNKWYCGRSGISHHNKTCSFKKLNQNPMISEQLGGTSVHEINESNLQQHNREQSKYEKERDVQNARIETMQQQIDEQKKEQKKMKDIIAAIEHHNNISTSQCLTQLQPHKSRDKRKKINKNMRQHVVNKQENACGMCKLTLTPYFEIDHIIGLQFGGTDDEANLMALCRECHAKKSITENQCRPQIKDAIQTILREKLSVVVEQRV